ncbi:hypothetical protein B0H10DRAFT_2011975 [Mycena sp. CBHHK59/15]|nr:hypothetical protein B0H10DRAFT_2011975 [Mycena sp. CBHHK59/15]
MPFTITEKWSIAYALGTIPDDSAGFHLVAPFFSRRYEASLDRSPSKPASIRQWRLDKRHSIEHFLRLPFFYVGHTHSRSASLFQRPNWAESHQELWEGARRRGTGHF